MRLATWNVNSLNVRLPHLEQWLREFGPDIVGIQETKLEDHNFPQAEIEAAATRAREDLRKQVSTLAVTGAEKLLRREIDANAHKALLDELEIQHAGVAEAVAGARTLLGALSPARWALVTSASLWVARHRLASAGLP